MHVCMGMHAYAYAYAYDIIGNPWNSQNPMRAAICMKLSCLMCIHVHVCMCMHACAYAHVWAHVPMPPDACHSSDPPPEPQGAQNTKIQ